MTRPHRILVVEDEEAMIAGLDYALRKEGFEVLVAKDGEEAVRRFSDGADLVLLDLMLPKRSGFDVLRAIRATEAGLPVILLTAKGQEIDKVRGFDLGADDYVTKPFGLAELLARIRARLRRKTERVPDLLAIGDASLDLKGLSVTRSGSRSVLTIREADMVRLLWRNLGQTVPRRVFLREIWGHSTPPATRTVDQHVAKLRQKIESDPANPLHILTVFGVGYRLEK